MSSTHTRPVGGGLKKVLYTLRVATDSGWRPTAKALSAKNACKACGLGMGGQRGGMTNELGEFPSVCNKSVQAQSSDLQAPIPEAIFEHTLADLRELDEREMNLLGRLNHPLYKSEGEDRFHAITWEQAIDIAAGRFASTAPDRTFFYSSGRASNEAGFVLQLLARLYGTNNVNNCSYYCHQATSEALQSTVGTATATVELADLKACDFVLLLGANPASNHPRFIYELQACRERGGEVVVVNPAREPGLVRFAMPKSARSLIAGGSAIATEYLQPKIGSDIALLSGIAKAVLESGGEDVAFLEQYTDGFAAFESKVRAWSWQDITNTCGVAETDIRRVAEKYCCAKDAVFAWGMGLTHHLHGVENVEQVANLAMLRGMIGKRFAGLLPLRGHSNVQGIGTIGVKPVLPEAVFDAIQTHLDVRLPTGPGLDTMSAMQSAAAGGIDVALMMGGNLYASNPDSKWAANALGRIPFKMFLTTTLNRGHVHGIEPGAALVLPVTARDEEWQPTTQESMFNYVRLSDGGIKRQSNARPESVVLCELAARLVPSKTFDFRAFRDHSSVRAAIAATVPGMGELASIDVARREFHIADRVLHTPEFRTPDGKCHFKPPSARPGTHKDYAYTLATVRSEGQFNSIVYEERDTYRGVANRWSVMMNLQDMASLGVEPGDRVTLRSAQGVMRDVEVYECDLPRGNLLAYFPEANVLTGTAVDPRSRTPAFKATPVNVRKGNRHIGKPLRAG